MWMREVARKGWMRLRGAGAIASAQRRISASFARDRPQTVDSRMMDATECTASKSPLLAAGKPASITSTRIRSS